MAVPCASGAHVLEYAPLRFSVPTIFDSALAASNLVFATGIPSG